MNTEHVNKRYKKRKGKLNIIHRRLTHNYILTKKKTKGSAFVKSYKNLVVYSEKNILIRENIKIKTGSI